MFASGTGGYIAIYDTVGTVGVAGATLVAGIEIVSLIAVCTYRVAAA